MTDAQKLGSQAEIFAKEYLQKIGYQIIDTNYRCSLGEIDIIAKDHHELVFIEVKSLSNAKIFDPMDHMTIKKQKKLIQLAQSYTSSWVQDIDQRIDIILVYCHTTPWTLNHFKNAIEN
ncbi:MAG: YraN family protein [Bdellovibrionales bacterium]|nr:YraN family protein [Bdellovibrionales bacterium]